MAEIKRCKKCGKIASWNSYFNGYMCECGNIERKTITNADRIRAMSDEELAKFIKTIKTRAALCKAVKNNDAFEELCSAEWLKQPAE